MDKTEIKVTQNAGTIEFNFEALKDQLSAEMTHYKGMIFTEETKKEAKETVANLRKLKKDVRDKRIEVKKSFMRPYDDFEAKVKELDALIDEPIAFINGQVEEFERKRVEERKQLINHIYEENISDMKEFLPLQLIYDSKWENATTSKKSIKDSIIERVDATKKDVDTINSMSSDDVPAALELYKRTLSLADAIAHINRYEQQKAEILKREKENENARQEEAKEIQPEQPTRSPESEFVEPEEPEAGVVTYRIKADPFQIAQVESAMREYGIEFERI